MLVYINIWKTAQYIEDNSNKVNQRNCWKCPIKVMNVNWIVLSKIFKEIQYNCWKYPIKVINVNWMVLSKIFKEIWCNWMVIVKNFQTIIKNRKC